MPALPLFPLGAVLVPGESLPLRIFEHRYVVLLRDLLRQGRDGAAEFGVVGIRAGHEVGPGAARALHDVGCSAVLERLADGGDGTFEAVARGARRFRLDGIDDGAHTPYQIGHVTWLRDQCRDAELVADLATRVRAAVADYRAQVGLDEVLLPEDPAELSFEAMGHVMLDVADRQAALAARDVDTRLRLVLGVVRREATLQRELGAVPGAFRPSQPAAN